MGQNDEPKGSQKKKPGFFERMFCSIDKKLEEKAKKSPCCCQKKTDDSSCCG